MNKLFLIVLAIEIVSIHPLVGSTKSGDPHSAVTTLKDQGFVRAESKFAVAGGKQINFYQLDVANQGAAGAVNSACHAIKNGTALVNLVLGREVTLKNKLSDDEYAQKFVEQCAAKGPNIAVPSIVQTLEKKLNYTISNTGILTIVNDLAADRASIEALNNAGRFPAVFILDGGNNNWRAVLITKSGGVTNYSVANSQPGNDFAPMLQLYLQTLVEIIDGNAAVTAITKELNTMQKPVSPPVPVKAPVQIPDLKPAVPAPVKPSMPAQPQAQAQQPQIQSSGDQLYQQLKAKNLIIFEDHFAMPQNKQINLYQVKVVDQYLKDKEEKFIFGGAASCAYHAVKNGNALLKFSLGQKVDVQQELFDVDFASNLISPPNGQWRTIIVNALMPALLEIVKADPTMAGKNITPQIALDFLNTMAADERPFSQEDLQGDWLDLQRIQLLLEHANAKAFKAGQIVIVSNAETEINKIKAVKNFPTLFILGTMTGALQKGHWLAVLVTKNGNKTDYFVVNSGGDHDFNPELKQYLAAVIKGIDGEQAVNFIKADQAAKNLPQLKKGLTTMSAQIKKAQYEISFELFERFRDYFERYKNIVPGPSEFDAVYKGLAQAQIKK